jgi:hypothetical protein
LTFTPVAAHGPGVFIVALHRRPDADEAQVRALAAALELTAVEVRGRLAGEGPVVVARRADRGAADALAVAVRGAGFIPLVVDADAVENDADRFVVRRLAIEGGVLHGEDRAGEARELACRDVRLLVRATAIAVETTTETTKTRQFSAGRALVTGGLSMTKTTKTTRTRSEESWTGRLYCLTGSSAPWVFDEDELVHDGLGQPLEPTRLANFNRVCERLRAECAAARYDDRLMRHAGLTRLLGPWLDPASHLDLAVALLAASAGP